MNQPLATNLHRIISNYKIPTATVEFGRSQGSNGTDYCMHTMKLHKYCRLMSCYVKLQYDSQLLGLQILHPLCVRIF